MRLWRIALVPHLVACALNIAAQIPQRSEIAAALDAWAGRAGTRDAISKISRDPLPALIYIAQSIGESEIHRSHALALLATFKDARSGRALDQIANDSNPTYRCLALQSLAELKSRGAVPTLISRLDDQGTCIRTRITDPAEERDVYVSDEAVRLLEQVTGQSFAQESGDGHRPTKPWKDWWSKSTNH